MDPLSFFGRFKNLERTGDFHQARTLDRVRELLDRVGNPQLRLPPSVIVAGSKGKGSTTHLIASVLGASGLRTGMYTSPHIGRWNERIVAEGQEITDQEASALLDRFGPVFDRPTAGGELPTYFEAMTTLAFLHFTQRELDAVVLEIGLGGTFDAVNVCDAPVGVITQLGLEHQRVLGSTLAMIAKEKAGIMRPGQYTVLESQPVEAMAVLWAEAERVGALHLDAERWHIRPLEAGRTDQTFDLWQADASLGPLRLRLLGEHQLRNARLAVIAALAFGEKTGREIPDEAIGRGLFGVKVPARMEIFEEDERGVIWLIDGAHSRESAAALASAVRRHFADRPVRLAAGMMRDKDPQAFLKELMILKPEEVMAVGVDSDRAWSPDELARSWSSAGQPVQCAARVSSAVERLKQSSRPGDLIVITGSLYLAGEARKALRGQ